MSDTETPDLKHTRRRRAAPSVDRLPPHSLEAEQGVLGCVLISPNDCLGICIEKIKGVDIFYDLRHQAIYREIVAMNDGLDIITLQQRLKDKQLLEQVGGIPYLNTLQDAVPSAANLTYYLDIVLEKAKLRRLIQTCTGAVSRAYDYTGEIDDLMSEFERDVLAINHESKSTDARPILNIVHGALGRIEDKINRKGEISGLSTGFADLDQYTDGMHAGDMMVIAARPSIGKTSLCMQIAEHVAVGLQIPVGVFSLEMTADSLIERALYSMARVNSRGFREGFVVEDSVFLKITSAAGKLSKAPLYIDDTPGLSIGQLRARARRMWQQFGIKLFIVDYMQRLHSTANKAQENRQQEIADISSGLKSVAVELRVPLIVAGQLNRESEKRTDRKPKLVDLRESGAIEQDADFVGLLYKPGVTDVEQDEEAVEDHDGVPVDLHIAKQRNGPAGVDVHFTFLKPFTRFESRAKIETSDVPQQQELKT